MYQQSVNSARCYSKTAIILGFVIILIWLIMFFGVIGAVAEAGEEWETEMQNSMQDHATNMASDMATNMAHDAAYDAMGDFGWK